MSFLDKIQKFLYMAEDKLKENVNNVTGSVTFTNFNKDNTNTQYHKENKEVTTERMELQEQRENNNYVFVENHVNINQPSGLGIHDPYPKFSAGPALDSKK